MKKLLFFIFAFFLVLRVHGQCPGPAQRTALLNLQKAGIVESSRAGQIPLTDACGNLRYAQYTEVDLVPISYTPSSTGNTQNYSEFVTTLSGDVWYIDWQGRAIKVWNNSGGGSGANDYDWLNIADNTIPDNIADSIYTGKYASVNMRRVWPNAQMLVGDSTGTNGASGIVAGDRSARWGFVRMLDSTWSSIGQEGTNNTIRLGPGTTAFKVQGAAGPSPSQATAPFRDVASFRTDSLIRFNDYPNTRMDDEYPINFLYTDIQGFVRSRPYTNPSIDSYDPMLFVDISTSDGITNDYHLFLQPGTDGDVIRWGPGGWAPGADKSIYNSSGTAVSGLIISNNGNEPITIRGTGENLKLQDITGARSKTYTFEDNLYKYTDETSPFDSCPFEDYENGLKISGTYQPVTFGNSVVLRRYFFWDGPTRKQGLRTDYTIEQKGTRKGVAEVFRNNNNTAFFAISGANNMAKYLVAQVDSILLDNRNIPDVEAVKKLIGLRANSTIDFPAFTGPTMETIVVTVSGVNIGDFVQIAPLVTFPSGVIKFDSFVSGTNQVTVRAENTAGYAIDLTPIPFNIIVTKY